MFLLMLEFGKRADKAISAGMDACKPGSASVAITTAAVAASVKDWVPTLNKVQVLTPQLRDKLAGALGHLSYNLWAAANKQPIH